MVVQGDIKKRPGKKNERRKANLCGQEKGVKKTLKKDPVVKVCFCHFPNVRFIVEVP